ncbi:hypothetical protein SAMN05444422_1225 [Halobiforma haloterrestris]|uniref:Uncharacterized protein n=1 Tax=Natronobacterium haloterrestre TaxID=148448 RepID=A0A1I1LRX6_NATHA|nr:helix-turn-helix transcriptional regulator [Halobiforma haloterrestris]SFC75861.1 hypothetical protein SAMN05444422_1225 [Halobiforma haloterrestris]
MSGARFTPGLDLDGLSPDEAFAVLGNEIRLDIIRVLWHADAAHEYDDVSDTAETIPFSELRRLIDVEDNGKFNYHLSQLTPHFVRHTDDGYRLSGAGKQIARTVIAVSGEDQVDFSAPLERDCPLCNAPMTVAYEDQWIRISCSECEGVFGDKAPEESVFFSSYPAAGLADRTPDEALRTGFYRCMLDIAYMMRDVCRECAGSISTSVSVCEDHRTPAREPCPRCGTRFPAWTDQRCDTCGFAKRLPVEPFVLTLSPVVGFLASEGIDILTPDFTEIIEPLQDRVETTVTEDPVRVSVTIEGETRTLSVSLDDELEVVGLDRRRSV